MASESGKHAASVPSKTKPVDAAGEESHRASGVSLRGSASSSTWKPPLLSPTDESDRTPPVTPAIYTEPPSPADARVPGVPPRPATPHASSGFHGGPQKSSTRVCGVGRTGKEDAEKIRFKHGSSFGKDGTGVGVPEPSMPACFQSFLFSDGESGSGRGSGSDPSDPSDAGSGVSPTSSAKEKEACRGCSTKGDRPSESNPPCSQSPPPPSSSSSSSSASSSSSSSSATLGDAPAGGSTGSPSVGHPLRAAAGDLKKVSSQEAEMVHDEGRDRKPPPAVGGGGGVPKKMAAASGRTGTTTRAMGRGRYLDKLPPKDKLLTASAAALSPDRDDVDIEKQRWKRWMESGTSSSEDDASAHGKKKEEEEEGEKEDAPLQASPRSSAHPPPHSNTVLAPPRSREANRKPGSPVFQHGRAMRGGHHVAATTMGNPSEASSRREKKSAKNASRITHRRSVSPPSKADSDRPALLGHHLSSPSRIEMPPSPGEGKPPADIRGPAAISEVAGVPHEAAGSQQPQLTRGEDTRQRPDGPGAAGQSGTLGLPLPPRVIVPASVKENPSAAGKRVVGLPPPTSHHEKDGKFDMLSSNISFSDSEEGTTSEIDVCDFLELSDSSVAGGGAAAGDAARAFLDSKGSDYDPSDDDDNPQGVHNTKGIGTLDEQDIAFLAENRELREAMLGVEDLHFGKLPLIRQVELIRDLSTVRFSSGDVIFGEGQPSDALYVNIDPTASVFQHDGKTPFRRTESKGKAAASEIEAGENEEDDITRRAFVPPGRIFGEHGLIYSAAYSRPATVRAAVDMSCAVLHAPAFPRWSEFRLCLLIKKVPLLADLSPVAQTLIIDSIDYRDFQPDDLIVREGEPAEAFFMITSGVVAVTKTIRDDAASDSSGLVSSEGHPATSPSTTDDSSSGAFSCLVTQKDSSQPSTPEILSPLIKRPDHTDVTVGVGVATSPSPSPHGGTVEGKGEGGGGNDSRESDRRGVVLEGGGPMLDSTIPSPPSVSRRKIKDETANKGRPSPPSTVGTDTHQQALKRPEISLKGPEAAVKGSEMVIKGSEMSLKGPENTLKGPDTALKGPETALKGPETALKGPEMVPKGSEMALKGPETVLKGPETALKGPETTLKDPETVLKGSEMVIKGPELAADGGSIAFPEREQSPSYAREIPLTRLYEGTFFGEMALIYDEPRNANIRAATKVTCIYLLKEAFMKCLADKSFHELMERTALRTACTRETRDMLDKQARIAKARLFWVSDGPDSRPQPAPTQFRLLQCQARSSFRRTLKMTRGGDNSKETRTRMVNKYRVCHKVGEGSFGEVFKVVHTETDTVYAMKVMTRPRKGRRKEHLESSLKREVSVMKRIRHPNIVTLWEAISDPRSRKVYLIQEFMEGGPLLKEEYVVEPLPGDVAIAKFIQAARGVHYIHSYGVCHGDIKPSNILEDAHGRVKIADLGACVILRAEDEGASGDSWSSGSSIGLKGSEEKGQDGRRRHRKRTRQRLGGTPGFQAPELFGEGGSSRTSFASDVWALGVSLYQMVVGRMPFYGSSYRELMLAIQMEAAVFPTSCHVQPNLVNLLQRMLDKNPSTRITLAEAMQHESVTREGVCIPQWEGEEEFAQIGAGGGHEAPSEWARLTIVHGQNFGEKRRGGPEALGGHMRASPRTSDDLLGRRSSRFKMRANSSAQSLSHGELDDSTAQMRSSRLVRKPDFLMPRTDPVWESSGKVVLSSPYASGALRPSYTGEIGTRRLSLLPRIDDSDSSDAFDPSSSSAHGGGGVKVYWTWDCRDFYGRNEEGNLEEYRRRSTGTASSKSTSASRGMHNRGVEGSLRGERSGVDPNSAGNPRWLRGQQSDKTPTTTRGGHPGRHMHTVASLLLPVDVEPPARHQHPPPRHPPKTSNSDPGPAEKRPYGGGVRSGQGAGSSTTRGRRWSSGPLGGESGGARAREEGRRLSSMSLRTPVIASLGLDRSVDRSMDRINEEDPRITDNPPGFDSAMISPNTPATELPPCASLNDGHSRGEDNSGSSNLPPPLPPPSPPAAAFLSEHPDNATISRTDRTSNFETQELRSRHHRALGISNEKPDNTEQHKFDGDRASPHPNVGAVNYKEAGAGEGEGEGEGTGAGAGEMERIQLSAVDRMDCGSWRATKREQQLGVNREDCGSGGSISVGEDEGKDGEGEQWDNRWIGGGSNSSENGDDDDDDDGDRSGSESLVVDITDNLGEIGEGAKRQDDEELLVLDREEIITLSGDNFPGGSSINTSTGESTGSIAKHSSIINTPRSTGKSTVGHVQARVWAGQENLDVGVRFGHSLSQGNRRSMEDTATYLADACGALRRSCETQQQQHSEDTSTTSPSSSAAAAAALAPPAATAAPAPAPAAPTAAPAPAAPAPAPAPASAAPAPAAPAPAATPTASPGDPTNVPSDAAAYFGIYDGHGGPEVALYLEEVLHNHVLDDPLFPSDIPKAIVNACMKTDLECLEASRRKHLMGPEEQPGKAVHEDDMSLKKQMTKQDYSGAVAVLAIVHRSPSGDPLSAPDTASSPPTDKKPSPRSAIWPPTTTTDSLAPAQHLPLNNHYHRQHGNQGAVFLHVANVGDCRGVLCRAGTAVVVTRDHTPSVPCEAARVEEAGGFVSRGRVNGILGVSRSFGDIHCKAYPPREGNDLWEGQQVISRPDVHSIQLTKVDNFLILACDGVWDVLSNQEAVSYVHRRLLIHRDVQRAAVELVNKAVETSGDNCSCIVICLNQHTAHRKRQSSRLSQSSASSGGSGGDVPTIR